MMPRAADNTDVNAASQELFSQSCTAGNDCASAEDSVFLKPLPIPAAASKSVDGRFSEKFRHIRWNESHVRAMPERTMTATYDDAVERPTAVVQPSKSLPLPSTSAGNTTTTESSARRPVRISTPSQNRTRSRTSSANRQVHDVHRYGDLEQLPDEDEVVIHGSSSAESDDDDDGFDWHV